MTLNECSRKEFLIPYMKVIVLNRKKLNLEKTSCFNIYLQLKMMEWYMRTPRSSSSPFSIISAVILICFPKLLTYIRTCHRRESIAPANFTSLHMLFSLPEMPFSCFLPGKLSLIVSVCLGCYNKIPQTGWLITNQN